MLVYRVAGVLKCLRLCLFVDVLTLVCVGVLVCWSVVVLVCRYVGVLVCWCVELSTWCITIVLFWLCVGLPVCLIVGLLVCGVVYSVARVRVWYSVCVWCVELVVC